MEAVSSKVGGSLCGTFRSKGARGIALAAVALAMAACSFDVPGFDLAPLGSNLLDLSGDFQAQMTDLPPGAFVPSNVSPTHVQEGAATLSGPHDIDTEMLLIDMMPPPVGVVFVPEATHDDWAVLSVRDFDVTNALVVHGRRGLVVIAVGDVHIAAIIHAEAKHRLPGPGGQFTGLGHGGDGKSNGAVDSGGGGGGHGAVGATGGPSIAITDNEGGTGGPTYADALLGGSGGGTGAGTTWSVAPCPVSKGFSLGGAGGGILQISAKGMLDLVATGGIHAGGGGGRGGCYEAASAGGGGGSGGTIWLEALGSMRVLGILAANGGGGGSGGKNGVFIMDDGIDGADALLASTVAVGGASQGTDSGAGGNGGALAIAAAAGHTELNAGGGGGAVGQVRLRTHVVAPITDPNTVTSPPVMLTTDF